MKKIFPRIDASTFFCAVLLLVNTFSLGQKALSNADSPATAHMRLLNNSLLHLHGQMQQADASSAPTLRGQAATVMAQRAAALNKLIQNDPHAALTFAFSPELLADLTAKFPGPASRLEQHGTWQGPIEYWIADAPDLKSHWSRILMAVGQQKYELHFVGPEPAYIKSGTCVQVIGVALGNQIAVESSSVVQSTTGPISGPTSGTGSSGRFGVQNFVRDGRWTIFVVLLFIAVLNLPGWMSTRHERKHLLVSAKQSGVYALALILLVGNPGISSATAAACSTTGQQNAVVLLATAPGATVPAAVTPQSVRDAFFGSTPPTLDGYWREASHGKMWLTGDVFGWYTLSGSYSCSNVTQMRDDAIAAASAAGVNFQMYNQVYVVIPDYGCGWSGLTYVGCSAISTPSGTFNAATSWLNSKWMATQNDAVHLISHEGGHQLGLNHSGTLDNGAAVLGPLSAPGTANEMGDWYSTMGTRTIGIYPAPQQAEILGWMAAGTNYETVQSSGTYILQPLEMDPAGLQAIKVQRGTGNNAWLWVEYRQPIGAYDSTLSPYGFAGALIHYEDSTTGAYTKLLDFTPGTSTDPYFDFYDSPLSPAQSWQDPYTDLSLTVSSATSSGVTVSVNYNTVSCNHADPSVSISPLDPSTYPGVGAGYNMSVTNNDSAACSASLFTPSSTQPAGWTSAFSASSISLNPGQSGSLTMTQTPPASTTSGTYPLNASAANSSYVGSAAANLTVLTAPSLSVIVSVPSSSYAPKSTVPITATVLNGGSTAVGVSVTFKLTTPNGKVVTQSGTTDASGTATWKYKLSPNSPTGKYSVTVQASLSSTPRSAPTQSATSSPVSFTVQ
jgi:M6 family metalloprotease-like protein